jgi:hypothetical protein
MLDFKFAYWISPDERSLIPSSILISACLLPGISSPAGCLNALPGILSPAPAAGNPFPVTAMLPPFAGYPYCAGTIGFYPVTARILIIRSTGVPIVADPDITTAGRRRPMGHVRRRWADMNIYLSRAGKGKTQHNCQYNCQFKEVFFHNKSFFLPDKSFLYRFSCIFHATPLY